MSVVLDSISWFFLLFPILGLKSHITMLIIFWSILSVPHRTQCCLPLTQLCAHKFSVLLLCTMSFSCHIYFLIVTWSNPGIHRAIYLIYCPVVVLPGRCKAADGWSQLKHCLGIMLHAWKKKTGEDLFFIHNVTNLFPFLTFSTGLVSIYILARLYCSQVMIINFLWSSCNSCN